MIKRYPVNSHTSEVEGRPGRLYDWSLFCWNGQESLRGRNAPLPAVDDEVNPHCQYLHVPYDYAAQGTIYRVRPNKTMRAGATYRGLVIREQKAIHRTIHYAEQWYWELHGERRTEAGMNNYPDGMTRENWQHIDGEQHYLACPLHEDNYGRHECSFATEHEASVEWNQNHHQWEVRVPHVGWTPAIVAINYCPWCGEELEAPECQCDQIKEGMRPCP